MGYNIIFVITIGNSVVIAIYYNYVIHMLTSILLFIMYFKNIAMSRSFRLNIRI